MNEKTEKVLKVGMIGTGSSATNIAETISKSEMAKLVGIANHRIESAQKLAEKYNIDFVTDDYKQLCKKNDIDFIIISTPHALHYEQAKYALNQNKHVLVEKPITTKVSDAEDLIKIAKQKKLKLGVHFQCRFFGAVKKAKELIDQGVLGKILQVNISVMWFRPHEYYYDSSWRGKWELEGGGSLINQAIHPVDEMIYILGDVKSVFGYWGAKYHEIETEDNSAGVFLMKNGAFGTIQTSTATKAAFPAKLTIFGVEGGIEINGNILTHFKADGSQEIMDFTKGGQIGSAKDPKKFSLAAHKALLEDFCNAILNDREPLVNGEEGLKSIKFVDAIYKSNGKKIISL
ncbi:MAG: Gfo/Idh/MocA family protein [Promethearchaeota archaeon]